MRLVKAVMLWCATLAVLVAQQPVSVGGDSTAGSGPGIVKFFDWYAGTPSGGCTNGASGFCVGPTVQGDTYYWTAWLPNASGLPVTTGLPVVGTINDFTVGSICSGNVAVLQMDKFSWAAPTASHLSKVNCMTSFGTSPAASNAPAGWNGHLTSSDSVGNAGTWKSRVPFSKGGILYLPVERQISAGGASVHDATYLVSPDSGKHWCNPYTWANRAGSPGCDSGNWQSDGDAPKCDATSSSTPCTNAGYLDSAHSSMMWKGLAKGENWEWINYGYQDGGSPPAGINDGCDPAVYTCFMVTSGGGQLARVPNTSNILDISAWRYYTCPGITQTYRCAGSDPANWTATLANATPVMYQTYSGGPYNGQGSLSNPYSILYLKEFGSYIAFGQATDMVWAPKIQGPWTLVFRNMTNTLIGVGNFLSPSPALGYTVMSTNPPRVQLTANSNSYLGGQGSPRLSVWDLVLGREQSGEAFQLANTSQEILGAGYQFSDGHVAGSFPRNGLIWAFDFLDYGAGSGLVSWPFFVDRANNSVVVSPCNGGNYGAPTLCGSMNPGRGTSMNKYGIATGVTDYGAHFNTFAADSMGFATPTTAPSAMQGNASYSVVGVYRYEGVTNYRTGGIWSAGSGSGSDNTAVSLSQLNGTLVLDWNGYYSPRYHYVTGFTFPNYSNWYFVAVTVQAQTGGCGSNCIPAAKVWVGGAGTPGVVADVNAGVSYSAMNGATTKTPNVSAGPFVIGTNSTGSGQDSSAMSYATTMVYGRALSYPEIQMMYRSMKTKMAARGVTLQ